MLLEKLLKERSRCRREGIWARVSGIGPKRAFCERSRWWRRRQKVMAAEGRVEVMRLSEREREERKGRRQRTVGKGPVRSKDERLTAVTELLRG